MNIRWMAPPRRRQRRATGRTRTAALLAIAAALVPAGALLPAGAPVPVGTLVPVGALGEQASAPGAPEAGGLDVGNSFSCAIVAGGQVRCWGYGAEGELGYPGVTSVGQRDTPAGFGPVDIGAGHTARAISSGDYHTCAIRDDGTVLCWGYGADGRLGYGSTSNLGDTRTPGSAGPVNLGPGRTAVAISAGGGHTCAILDDGSVRCWGYGADGQLGYGDASNIGDTPADTPNVAGPVDLGPGRTAVAISAGSLHTCAILDDRSVRCWGYGAAGRLGYGNTTSVGAASSPGSAGPVDLGAGRTAVAISAGGAQTCAILDDGAVRCWGFGSAGELGNGSYVNVGDTPTTTPGMTAPVYLGAGHAAVAISVGSAHTCAIRDDGRVLCWGYGADGRLGYGSATNVGDKPTDTPGMIGPVKLGAGRTAVAISAGGRHTCARLDDGTVRCWGYGANGRLGYCGEADVGNAPASTPETAGPVNLTPGDGGEPCRGPVVTAAASEAARSRGFHACLARLGRAARRLGRAARRAGCVRRWGRTPGSVTGLRALARGPTRVELGFTAPGADASRPPAATAYLIKQSRRPIRGARDFRRARSLCRGACRFAVTLIGTGIRLTITSLRPHTVYYFAVAARDDVTGRPGPRTPAVRVETG